MIELFLETPTELKAIVLFGIFYIIWGLFNDRV